MAGEGEDVQMINDQNVKQHQGAIKSANTITRSRASLESGFSSDQGYGSQVEARRYDSKVVYIARLHRRMTEK